MSHIFDALQRSESENRADTQAPETATELLERAERQAFLQWQSESAATELADPALTEPGPLPLSDTVQIEDLAKRLLVPPEEARRADFAAVAGAFPSVLTNPSTESRLVCLTDRDSPAAEAFRLLKVRLRNLRKDRPLKKLLITSSTPREGKSFAAANLACILASGAGEKVLLIGGDLRRPTLSKSFGVLVNPGLCEYLRGECSLTSSIHRLENAGLWLLPAGSAHQDPLEIIQSGKLPQLFDKLADWFDWIIIDSPPMLPLADTTVWARIADGVLLVARRGVTEKRKLQKGLEAFASSKLIGVLLNSSNNAADKDYYYYRHETAAQNG